MAFFPTDWSSFAWGAVAGGLAAFATGFLKKAGEHTWSILVNKISPKPPEPIEVERTFSPTRFSSSQCAWVSELRTHNYEAKGFSYYPHPKTHGPCFRRTSDSLHQLREFLMVGPDAKQVTGA